MWDCLWSMNFITTWFDSLFLIGVLMWEVFSEGKIPYENRSNSEVVEDITTGFRLYKPRLASQPIYQIMNHCWKEVSKGSGFPFSLPHIIICNFTVCPHPQRKEPSQRMRQKGWQNRLARKWHWAPINWRSSLSPEELAEILNIILFAI